MLQQMKGAKKMYRKDWKIIYSSAEGVEARALEFLYGEMGDYMLRNKEDYALHTLPCIKADKTTPDTNAVIIGQWKENEQLQKFIKEDEVPENGYFIRIKSNPENPEKQLILIAGANPVNVLYGVVKFMDDILYQTAYNDGNGVIIDTNFFFRPFQEMDFADAPETDVRSIFTWAHPIGNFQEYFKNAARLKFNRVYMWNEYPPINAKEVVDYAHSWGIEVFWGFSWGWSTRCEITDISDLKAISTPILKEWHDVWSRLPGDGIYFQSFTETIEKELNGKSIAECVTEMVNYVANEILTERPGLKIVFGLHALSVKEKVSVISKTDPRLLILWEDCGRFPFTHMTFPFTPEENKAFVRKLFAEKHAMGLVYKGQLMQNWGTFAHQSGPYIMGHNGKKMQMIDLEVTETSWKFYDAYWSENGKLAYDLAQVIHQEGGKSIELNIAAQLNGPSHWPTAYVAELFWNSSRSYEEIIRTVKHRKWLI